MLSWDDYDDDDSKLPNAAIAARDGLAGDSVRAEISFDEMPIEQLSVTTTPEAPAIDVEDVDEIDGGPKIYDAIVAALSEPEQGQEMRSDSVPGPGAGPETAPPRTGPATVPRTQDIGFDTSPLPAAPPAPALDPFQPSTTHQWWNRQSG